MTLLIDTTSGDFDFTYLSLGAGVQSSALLVLACLDDRVPKPDAAIFADTGDEPSWVLEYVEVLTEWAESHDVPVYTVQNKRGALSYVYTELRRRGEWFARIPLFVRKADNTTAMSSRHCTREFKIAPIQQKVRELLGYRPRQRAKHKVRAMMGISIDESIRMKASVQRWITNTYPLVDLGITRSGCYEIVDQAGLPEPRRSACVYCPYHSDEYWYWLKTEEPAEFARAVEHDRNFRDLPTMNYPQFVHRSCVPLDEVVFNTTDLDQVDMWAECEGMCGV